LLITLTNEVIKLISDFNSILGSAPHTL